MDSSRRRTVLRALLGAGMAGVAGCSALNGGGNGGDGNGGDTDTTAGGAGTDTPAANTTDAPEEPSGPVGNFTFSVTETGVTIQNAANVSYPANQVTIEHAGASVGWHELGSTNATVDESVTQGSTATIGSSILNWPTDLETGPVEVVLSPPNGSATTLASYEFDPSEMVSETPADPVPPTATPIEGAEVAFRDDFEDGQFLDQWEYAPGTNTVQTTVTEDNGLLSHEAPKTFGTEFHGDIVTQEAFDSNARVRLTARLRPRSPDYWGFGFGIAFQNTTQVLLVNQRFRGFDRLGVFGVEDPPAQYASETDDGSDVAAFEAAATDPEFVTYSMTLDLGADELLQVTSGLSTYVQQIDIDESTTQFQVLLGGDAGHEFEVDFVRLELL